MPKMLEPKFFNGAQERIRRLGMQPLWDELVSVLTGFNLTVLEERDRNGGAALRELIDARFVAVGGWEIKKSGGVDWKKTKIVNGTTLCIGVEIQVSIRSELLIIDVTHLRDALIEGTIDVGVIVTPSDRLAVFLTDRAPNFRTAIKTVTSARAEDLPLVVIPIEHDGPGAALPKREKRPVKPRPDAAPLAADDPATYHKRGKPSAHRR